MWGLVEVYLDLELVWSAVLCSDVCEIAFVWSLGIDYGAYHLVDITVTTMLVPYL